MNWGAFDLNLLIVFDAVMQERSVTRAGSRIGLCQPAMSHALNRLRYMLKDELFIRTPEGMVPTPRAETLAQPLRSALSEMQLALEPAAFDPAASDRRFALAVVAAWGIALVIVAATDRLAIVFLGIALGGLVYAPYPAAANTLLQHELADGDLTAGAIVWSAAAGGIVPLGTALGGPLVALVGPRSTLITSAIATVLLALFFTAFIRGGRGG